MRVPREAHDATRFVRLPEMRGLEVLEASFVSYSFARHTHDTFAIGVIDEGAAAMRCRGLTIVAPRGTILLVSPGEAHTGERFREAPVARYRMIYPSAEWIAIAVGDPRLVQSPLVPRDHVIRNPEIRADIALLCASLLAPASLLERETRLVGVLRRLLSGAQVQPTLRAPASTRRACEYLHAYATESISIFALADEVSLSPSQLVRSFRRCYGLTPHAYQTQRRIEIAKHHLGQGMRPADVASATGFFDQSHLNLHFKRRVGVTPAAYRRAHLTSPSVGTAPR